MASRNASRTVMVTISVPAGTSGSGSGTAFGGGDGIGGGRRERFGFLDARAGFLDPLRRGRIGLARCLARRRLAVLEGGGVLALGQDHRDRRVDRDVVGAFRHQDLAERALVDRLHLHGGLVGLDLGDDVAGFDRVALLLVPLGEVALLHRGRERGHQHFDRHGRITGWLA